MAVRLEEWLSDLEGVSSDFSVSLDNITVAKDTISNISIYFEEVIPEDIADLSYASLFNKENGILKFIQNASTKKKSYDDAILLGFDLIINLVQSKSDRILKYVGSIKDFCWRFWIVTESAPLKGKALEVLVSILECTPQSIDEQPEIMVEKLMSVISETSKPKVTVLQRQFQLLGILSRRYPEKVHCISEKIFSVFLNRLDQQVADKSGPLRVISGRLDGLCDYLCSFPLTAPEQTHQRALLCKILKLMIIRNEDTIRSAHRAALNLIAKHGDQLSKNMAEECKWWNDKLWEWGKSANVDDCKAGLAALDTFYQEISKELLEIDASTATFILKYLIKDVQKKIRDFIRHPELRLVIKALGYLSTPCKELNGLEEVSKLFSDLVQHAENVYFRSDEAFSETILHLPVYLEAMSRIIGNLNEVTINQVAILQKLTVLLMEHVPSFLSIQMFQCTNAFIVMMHCLRVKGVLFESFLETVLFQGLIYSCAHLVLLDAMLLNDQKQSEPNTSTELTTYKNYLPFWEELFRLGNKQIFMPKGISINDCKGLVDLIFDHFIKSIFILIDRLDLQLIKYDDLNKEGMDISKDGIHSRNEFGLQASSAKDMQIFVNLVDLSCDILSSIELKMLNATIVNLLMTRIINYCESKPLISGFFKLLASCLHCCNSLKYFENCAESSEEERIFNKTSRFLQTMLMQVNHYKGDHQVSRLKVLLAMPAVLIKPILVHISSPMQVVFKIGYSYIPLAMLGVDSLEKWTASLPPEDWGPVLIQILPYLGPYVKSSDSKIKVNDLNSHKLNKRTPYSKRRYVTAKRRLEKKNQLEIAKGSQLHQLQKRVLLFLGQLPPSTALSLLGDENSFHSELAASWDNQQYLSFSIPLPDIKLCIYIDKFLPRIVDLSLTSSDRKTRITACELLHSFVMYLLGKGVQLEANKPGQLSKIVEKVIPALIQLGCDSDFMVKQLFNPLLYRLSHWYSHKWHLKSQESSIWIEALLDGLCHPDDASVRELSANCLKEYVEWSMRQLQPKEQESSSVNVKAILKKICSFSLHSCAYKRIGASLALNHLYTLLREEDSIINQFWLELLYYQVLGLEYSESASSKYVMTNCVQHLEKVIIRKEDVFNKFSEARRKPPEFEGVLLGDAVFWLLKQCGSLSTTSRKECMRLVINLSPHVNGCGSAKEFITNIIENGMEKIIFICEGADGLAERPTWIANGPYCLENCKSSDLLLFVNWSKYLLASLDCYIWVFNNALIEPSKVFVENRSFKIFESISSFQHSLECFDEKILKALLENSILSCEAIQTQDSCTNYSVIFEVSVKILKFLTILIDKSSSNVYLQNALSSLWNLKLWKLIGNLLFKERFVDCDTGVVEILQFELKHLVESIRKNLSCDINDLLSKVVADILESRPKHSLKDLPCVLSNEDSFSYYSFFKILLFLQESSMLTEHSKEIYLNEFLELDVLSFIFDCLFKSKDGKIVCVFLSQESILYIDTLLKTSFMLQMQIQEIVELVLDETEIENPYLQKKMMKGEHFYWTFKSTLITYFLSDLKNCFKSFFSSLSEGRGNLSVNITLRIIKDLFLDKRMKKKTCEVSSLSSCVSLYWSSLLLWCQESESKVIGLLGILLIISGISEPTCFDGKVCQWCISLLSDPKHSFNVKAKVLELLPCLVIDQENSGLQDEVRMQNMKNDLLKQGWNQSSFEAVLCKNILTTLDVLKSNNEAVLYGAISRHGIINEDILQNALKAVFDQFCPRAVSSSFDVGKMKETKAEIILTRVSSALEITCSPMLLRFFIMASNGGKNHINTVELKKSLSRMMKRAKSEKQYDAICTAHSVTLDSDCDPTTRFETSEVFVTKMIETADYDVARKFFAENIKNIFKILLATLDVHTPWKLTLRLISKITCLKLVGLMFFKFNKSLELPDCPISLAFNDGKPNERQLISKITRKCLEARKMYDSEPEEAKEFFRKYRCAAYNATIAIVANLKDESKFYALLYQENLSKGERIWDGLMDLSDTYNCELSQDFEKNHDEAIFKVPILEGELTRKRKLNDIEESELLIRSRTMQNLSGSSLCEVVAKFDFSDCSVKSLCWAMEDGVNYQSLSKPRSVVYESDYINNHECMATVCGLIQHMVDENIVKLSDQDQPIMPHWIKCFKEAIEFKERHNNVKIFLIKVMLNCRNCFSPYAKDLFMAVMDVVSTGCLGQRINYLVQDVVSMLFTWSDSITLSSLDGFDASKIFIFFILNAKDPKTQIFNKNMKFIRSIYRKWKDHIGIPYDIILDNIEMKSKSSPDTEVSLVLAALFLEHSLEPWEAENKERFLDHIRRNLESSYGNQLILLASANVIGMVLRLMDSDGTGHLEGGNQIFFRSVIKILENQSVNQKDTFLLCLYEIQKSYIRIVDEFINLVLFQLPQRNGKFKTLCLKIVLSGVENLERPFVELKDKGILNWLKARDPENQEITLNIIKKCLPLLEEEELKQLMDEIYTFRYHQNFNCRAAMYDILIWIFERYCQVQWARDSNLEENEETLWKFQCKEVLLGGLEDEEKSIQSKIFSFWERQEGLKYSDSTIDRLVTILQLLYSPTTEGSFLGYALSFLLSPSTSTSHYKEKLFEHALAECQFKDYPLLKSWRAQHVEMIPMFAETLVSQLSQVDLSSQLSADSTLKSLRLKATQRSLQFTPTQDASNESGSSSQKPSTSMVKDFEFKKPSPFGVKKILHRRHSRFEDERTYYAMREMKKNAKRQEMDKERREKREREITLFRQYRIGDFPDVQINCSDILNPLINLAKKDPIVGQQLFVSLFSSIIMAASADSSISHRLKLLGPECSNAFNRILNETTLYCGSLMGSLLEIGLHHNTFIKLDMDAVVSVGEPSGTSTLSCLYLEEKLNDWQREKSASTRSLYNRKLASNDKETWLQLAKVYQNINEYDIVHGVFHDMMCCDEMVKEALESERSGQWSRALHAFQHILNQPQSKDTAEQERDYYYEGYYKCLANLSRWELLNHEVKKQLRDESFDSIWNDSWLSEKLLPWIFVAQTRFAIDFEGNEIEEFIKHIHLWLKDKDKRDYLKTHFSKELSVLHFIAGDYDWARYHAAQSFDLFLQEWSHLSPLSVKRRASKLLEVQLLSEFSVFLSTVNVGATSMSNSKFMKLCNNWKVNMPTNSVCLRHWDERTALRQLYITRMMRMEEGIANFLNEGENLSLLQDLSSSMTLKVVDTAISLQNSHVAKKHLKRFESRLKNHSDPDLRLRWNIYHGFLPWAQTMDKRASDKNPLKLSLRAWELLDGVLHDPVLEQISHLQMDVFKKIFTVSATVARLLKENVSSLDNVDEHLKGKLYMWIQSQSSSSPSIFDRVTSYSINCLQKAILVAETLPSKSYVSHLYLTLATYCRSLMEDSADSYEEVCTKSLLRSMANGSVQAVQWFPCLLQFNFQNVSLSHLFIAEAQHVPAWMFLGWINQIFAHLNGTACSTLSGIVTKLAEVYPAAVMLPLRLYYEKYGVGMSNEPANHLIQRLKAMISKNNVLEEMLESLVYVCTPDVMLNYHLDRIISILDDPKSEDDDIQKAKELMMKEVFPVCCKGRRSQFHGKLLDTIQMYKKDVKEAFDCHSTQVMNKNLKAVKRKFISMQQKGGSRVKTALLLKDYSPWLSEFRCSGFKDCIEIPGQYTGETEPQIEKLTKIIGFLPHVSVMPSLRKPVCITILGSDGKEHKYLIKFGEDLRLDQRIEQVFALMNKVLADDPLGKERRSSINTYQVIPLSNRLGMIEWVHNTMPLSDVISLSMNEIEIREKKSTFGKYNTWLKRARPIKSGNNAYMNAFHSYGRDETVANYEELINNFSCDILRRSFVLLSQSFEGFWSIRNAFAISHGSLCIAHWLLGIGDRHMKNTLVSTVTGQVIGIDFGYSFGSATQFLPIPELMPFRLTPQILGLMQPFGEIGVIKEVMVKVLRALQKKSDILLATMDVFVKEPSLDWLENARRQAKTDGLSDLVESHMWYPKQKILLTKKKFCGGTNPVVITLEELDCRHEESSLLEKIKEVAQGQKGVNIRASLSDRGLTCEQQVCCLIDQATDYHILGKTWCGWEPWL